MRKFILSIFFGFSVMSIYAQNDCDTLACQQYADMNSFEIIGDAKSRERESDADIKYMISCDMLCAIEEAREDYLDVMIIYGSYTILVYKKEETIINEEK